MCCRMLQRVAVCCNVLQCVAVRCGVNQRVAAYYCALSALQCVAVYVSGTSYHKSPTSCHECVTWLIRTTWHIQVSHNSFTCDMTHSCVTWPIHTWHDPFTRNMTHSRVTSLIHVCHDSFMRHMTKQKVARQYTWKKKRVQLHTFACLPDFVCLVSLFGPRQDMGAKDMALPESDMRASSFASCMSSKEPYVPSKEPCISTKEPCIS